MFNRVLINPAYIGSRDAANVTLMVRKEWVAVNGSPQTNNLSFSAPINSGKMGIGGHLTQESIGPKKWSSGYVDYCYRIKIFRGQLSFGASAGAVSYNFNTRLLNLYDQHEPLTNGNSIQSATRFDINSGIYYHTRSFYIGLSATHLTSPRLFDANSASGEALKFYNLNRHLFLTLGKGFMLNDNLLFNPSVMVKSVMGKNLNVDLNVCFLIKNKVTLGVSSRSSYNLVAIAQYQIHNKFRIGYSYDYGFKGISRLSKGSHELALIFDFNTRHSKITTTRLL
jgi:type IX secretion system PorP/SprF family membrane protein